MLVLSLHTFKAHKVLTEKSVIGRTHFRKSRILKITETFRPIYDKQIHEQTS